MYFIKDYDYDYEKGRDRERGRDYSRHDRDRRDRNRGSSRESKYHDSYKKTDREYLPPAEGSFPPYGTSGAPPYENSMSYDGTPYHSAYPPAVPPQPYGYGSAGWSHSNSWPPSTAPAIQPPLPPGETSWSRPNSSKHGQPPEPDGSPSEHDDVKSKKKDKKDSSEVKSSTALPSTAEEDDLTTIDLDTRIAMMFKEKSFGAAPPFLQLDSDSDGEKEEKTNDENSTIKSNIESQTNEINLDIVKKEIETGRNSPDDGEIEDDVENIDIKKENTLIEDGASDISSDDDLFLKAAASPERPRSVKLEDDKMSLSSLSSTDDKTAILSKDLAPTTSDYLYPPGTQPYYYSNGTSATYDTYQQSYLSQASQYMPPYVSGFPIIPGSYVPSNDYTRRTESKASVPAKDPTEAIIATVIERVTEELKQILKKDFNKRMIENIAYKKFESWWDEQQKAKHRSATTITTTVELLSTTEPKSVSKPPDINQVLNNTRESFDSYNGFGLGLRTQFVKIPRIQRIRKPSSPERQDEDSKKDFSDQEDMVLTSDSEREQELPTSQTSYREKIKEEDANRKRKSGSVSSFFTSSSEDELSSQSDSDSESSSLSEVDELQRVIKPREGNKTIIYSDSDSEDEIKAGPTKSTFIKSKNRLMSDTLSEDEPDVISEIKISQKDIIYARELPKSLDESKPGVESDDTAHLPRTPGRETPKKQSFEYDRLYSDSEEEREYQEKRRRNTEYMEQIEREFMEEQMRNQQSEPNRMDADTGTDDEILPEKAPSPGEPHTPTISKLPPTPGAKLLSDPMNHLVSNAPNSFESKKVLDEKKLPSKKRKYTNETVVRDLDKEENARRDAKLSPASSDGGSSQESQTSQASQVAMEHCYSLPPSASPSIAMSSPSTQIEVKSIPRPSTAFDHDHGYTSAPSASKEIIPATSAQIIAPPVPRPGPGRPRKDPNQPKKPKKTKPIVEIMVPPKKEIVPFIPQAKYAQRNFNEQRGLLYQFLENGIDHEDIEYLRRSYEYWLRDDANSDWLNATHWMDHCVTDRSLIPPPTKKRRKDDDLKRHATGCARSEGFYKVDLRDKAKFKYHHTREKDTAIVNEIKSKLVSKVQGSREARSNQRRLLTAFGASTESELLKFNQLKFRKKQLKFAKSAIHDWGLFAMEPIAADEMVIEYVGQMIRPSVADLRETKYEAIGIGSSYLFRIDVETIIDATKCGNLARFINHSCNVSSNFNNNNYLFQIIFFFFN